MSEVVYDYVEDIDPNLICAICQSALVDPVTTSTCKHTYCRDCITRAIQVNPACPIDRSVLSIHSLRDTEQLVKLMLDELKVRCLSEGCGKIMQRGLLLSHIRTCSKTIITCPDGDCGIQMTRNRQQHHRAYECFQRKMECGKCGTVVTFRDNSSHKHTVTDGDTETCSLCLQSVGNDKNIHPWRCPLVQMPCPHQARGCSAIVVRSALPSHLRTCPYEGLTEFFKINDNRLRRIEERQDRLEKDNKMLLADLTDVRMNLAIAKRSLGSMWRLRQEDARIGPTTRPESNLRDGAVDQTERVSASNSPAQSPVSDVLQLPATTAPVTPNIVPSPTEESNDALQATPIHRTSSLPADNSQPTSGVPDMTSIPNFMDSTTPPSPRQSYVDWTFNRFSATGPSLDELISGLRSVIIHLAGGIDSMDRRNEVRAMTDSLRVMEEIGSLQSIVTAMRMQVMMDRPFPSSLRPITSPRTTIFNIPLNSSPQDDESDDHYTDDELPLNICDSRTRLPPLPPQDPQTSTSASVTAQPAENPITPTSNQQHQISDIGTESAENLDQLSVRESIVFSSEHESPVNGIGTFGIPTSQSTTSVTVSSVSSRVSTSGSGVGGGTVRWVGRPMGIPEPEEGENGASGSGSGNREGGEGVGSGTVGRGGANRLKRASTFGRSLLGKTQLFSGQPRL